MRLIAFGSPDSTQQISHATVVVIELPSPSSIVHPQIGVLERQMGPHQAQQRSHLLSSKHQPEKETV